MNCLENGDRSAFALFGVAMLDGLVMIDRIGSLREGDDACDLDAAVPRGGA